MTEAELKSIAVDAIIGLSLPKAATRMLELQPNAQEIFCLMTLIVLVLNSMVSVTFVVYQVVHGK